MQGQSVAWGMPNSEITMFSCLSEEQSGSRLEPRPSEQTHTAFSCASCWGTLLYFMWGENEWGAARVTGWLRTTELCSWGLDRRMHTPVLKYSSVEPPMSQSACSQSLVPSLARCKQLSKAFFILYSALYSPPLQSHNNYISIGSVGSNLEENVSLT